MALLPTKKITALPPYVPPLTGNELLEAVQLGNSVQIPSRAFVLPSDPLLTVAAMGGSLPGSRQLVSSATVQVVDNGPANTLTLNALFTGAFPGNPTSMIGLVPINGVAVTWMRSDAAPALDQSIVPNWTNQHTFSNLVGIFLSSVSPSADWNETDAAANNRRWRWGASGEQFVGQVVNDANSAAASWIAVDRTLNVIDSIALTSTALTWNGSPVITAATGFANPTASVGLAAVNGVATTAMRSDAAPPLSQAITPTWTGSHVFGNATFGLGLSSVSPRQYFNETDAAANNRLWTIAANAEQFLISAVNDADSASVPFITVDRTLNVIDSITAGGPLRVVNGLVGTPGVAFALDPDTGFYLGGANQFTIAAGGASIANFTTTVVNFNQHIDMIDGTAANPGYAFGNDPDCGIYRIGANTIGFAAGGLIAGRFDTAQFQFLDGLVGTPALTFISDPDTGIYRIAADQLGITLGGAAVMTFAAAGITSQALFFAQNGAVGGPGYSFASDPDTGIYRVGADVIGFTLGGVQSVRFEPTFTRIIPPILANDGAIGAPSYSFVNDPDTGMYGNAGNQIRFTAGGVLGLIVDGGHIYIMDGLVGTPGLSFSSDPDTGLYRVAANQLGLAAGAVTVVNVTSTEVNFNRQIHSSDGSVGAPGISFGNDPNTGLYRSGSDTVIAAAGGLNSIGWDSSAVGGDTRLLVYNDAGTLKRVLYGAADSGGAGFRMLRIAN